VYRPITIQKAIHILTTHYKDKLTQAQQYNDISINSRVTSNSEDDEDPNPTGNEQPTQDLVSSNDTIYARSPPVKTSQYRQRKCYAFKCRMLVAKGIIRQPLACVKGRNMCVGCNFESAKQRKARKLEEEVLALTVNNEILSPILECRTKPTRIITLRKMLSRLPSFANNSRHDCIFGAAKYLANTLGILLQDNANSSAVDEALSANEYKQLWRKATFLCGCLTCTRVTYVVRSFCTSCRYLAPYDGNTTHITRCPCCNIADSWELLGNPCLACQLASIVFQNPLHRRLEALEHKWLPALSSDSESNYSDDETMYYPNSDERTMHHLTIDDTSQTELLRMRLKSINLSLDSIRSQSTVDQNRAVFQELNNLKDAIQKNNRRKSGETNAERVSLSSTSSPTPLEATIQMNNNPINHIQGKQYATAINERIVNSPKSTFELKNTLDKSPTNRSPSYCKVDNKKSGKKRKNKWAEGTSKQLRNYRRTMMKKGLL